MSYKVGNAIASLMAATPVLTEPSEPNWVEKWTFYLFIAGIVWTALQIISRWLDSRRNKNHLVMKEISERLNRGNNLFENLYSLARANAQATLVVVDELSKHDLETHSKEILAEAKGGLKTVMTSSDSMKPSDLKQKPKNQDQSDAESDAYLGKP